MEVGSIAAIYFLVIVSVAFVTLPFGVKTDDEVGATKVAGQADSAPHRFDLKRHLLRAAIISVPLTALYYANYVNGWITASDLDFYN